MSWLGLLLYVSKELIDVLPAGTHSLLLIMLLLDLQMELPKEYIHVVPVGMCYLVGALSFFLFPFLLPNLCTDLLPITPILV